ncbi:MAG: hypothetical protein WBV77_10435 [Solirubrobacteraceae bacterium]
MTRKIWISPALVLATTMLALAPTTAFAGSPLLSGYGGPGAGEQAILGSTLIGGSRGGGASGSGGSGGSGRASLSGSAGASTSGSGGTFSTGSGSVRGSKVGTANAGSSSGARGNASKGGATSRAPRSKRATGVVGGSVSAYVYPTSQGSIPSASPLSGISSGGVLLLIGILVTLALVAVLTQRLSRLQS